MSESVLTLAEAQLLRLLSGFFGRERVLWNMSVLTICGGELPEVVHNQLSGVTRSELQEWARRTKCLFVVVSDEGDPALVVEFSESTADYIDVRQLEHERFLRPLLLAARVPYLTMSNEEFSDIVDPDASLDIFAFLKYKFEEQSDSFPE